MATRPAKCITKNVQKAARSALEAGDGILRLAPTWVPRSFLQPGKRLKLHPDDLYAFGLHRGGIDERWFGSTTEAANDNRTINEGLSAVIHDGKSEGLIRASKTGRPEGYPPGFVLEVPS